MAMFIKFEKKTILLMGTANVRNTSTIIYYKTRVTP